jgi:hypothetical protein
MTRDTNRLNLEVHRPPYGIVSEQILIGIAETKS